MAATSTSRISTSFNTKERLLDAGEELFAQHGIAGTSLRDLTNHAAANLASVNYHFGSKEGLLRALLERRIRPLNEERLRLLDTAERAAADGKPTLESILHAFVAPTIWMCRRHPHFMRVMGRMQTDPDPEIRAWMATDLFAPIVARLEKLLTAALPQVPLEELYWRMSFLVGAMCHTWTNLHDTELLSKGQATFKGDAEMIDRLVAYAAAGLRAGHAPVMAAECALPEAVAAPKSTAKTPLAPNTNDVNTKPQTGRQVTTTYANLGVPRGETPGMTHTA